MRLVLWCELSEEVKRKALKMYGEDRIEEYDCMDALFDDEIRTYYTLEEDMALALEKVRSTLPYEETAFAISQQKFIEQKGKYIK